VGDALAVAEQLRAGDPEDAEDAERRERRPE